MKVMIADDEIHLAEDLARRLERLWPELDIVAIVHDGEAAEQVITRLDPDVAFLDIRMPGKTGLEVARSAHAHCRIVFVTAYDDYAVAAFEQAAADYLLKPVSDQRLVQCIERLRQQPPIAPGELLARLQGLLQTQEPPRPVPLRWIRAQVGQVIRLVAVDEVCYFRAADKYTSVVTRDAELLIRMSLKELIDHLDPSEFWKIHRGTVVNVRHISAAHHDLLGRFTLSLRDRQETLAVSRGFAHLFRQM